MATAPEPQRVLVTGSAGAVGRCAVAALRARGHAVRGLDRVAIGRLDDEILGELTDPDAVARAAAGVTAVLHLAARPDSGDFRAQLVPSNVLGLYHVCEAARDAGARRLVLASSVQVIAGRPDWPERMARVDDEPAPRNAYAMTKGWAEMAGRLAATRDGLSVVAIRIGFLPRSPRQLAKIEAEPDARDFYLSHDDAGRLAVCAVESSEPAPGAFALVNGASRPHHYPRLDPEPARRVLGFAPRDTFPEGTRSEDLRDE